MEERDEIHSQETQADAGGNQPKQDVIWEVRIATSGILFAFIVTVASFVLAIFMSIYMGATTTPKVWRAPLQAQGSTSIMKPKLVRNCVKNLQALDQEQHQQSRSLWFQMRNGHRGHLTLWQEWSRSWRKRVKRLRLQCRMRTSAKGTLAKGGKPLAMCVEQFQKLSQTLTKKSGALWLKTRRGRKSDLRRWREWSDDWRRRLQLLVRRCPLYDRGDIAKAFQRASQTMLKLQERQEKAMLTFFGSSADLFRDLRQAMHSLKEELR